MQIETAVLTDVGKIRTSNEDSFGVFAKEENPICASKGKIFIVADGMGGHTAGELASKIAVGKTIREYYSLNSDNLIETNLEYSIQQANKHIFEKSISESDLKGMGSTITALVLKNGKGVIANVGDSRTYLIRKNNIVQITQDHSWVAEQVRNGILTVEQAQTHPNRNVITRALGISEGVEVDLFNIDIKTGDVFILCSDGLHSLVTDEEIKQITISNNARTASHSLIDLANTRGGKDNTTVIVLKIGRQTKNLSGEDTIRVYQKGKVLSARKKIFIALIICFLAIVTGGISLWTMLKQNKTSQYSKISSTKNSPSVLSSSNARESAKEKEKTPQRNIGKTLKYLSSENAFKINNINKDKIDKFLSDWRTAWRSRNIDEYSKYYDKENFVGKRTNTLSEQNYKEWIKYKEVQFKKVKNIKVEIKDIEIQILNQQRADVTFMQYYSEIPTYKAEGKKTMTIEEQNGSMYIVRENFFPLD